uniref:Uncharacterized protein n=1 Tax=Arundo donax TaxID=35708 RepID=A0A0A9DEM3_ARUDO
MKKQCQRTSPLNHCPNSSSQLNSMS